MSRDFIYEYEVKNCPLNEEQAEKVLSWMGINPEDAKQYCGVSTSRAILQIVAKDMKGSLYPREYQTTGFDRQ